MNPEIDLYSFIAGAVISPLLILLAFILYHYSKGRRRMIVTIEHIYWNDDEKK